MNKVTKEGLKNLETKVKSKKAKVADEATKAAIVKKATGDKKNLLYKYPKDIETAEQKKAFRTSCRKKIASLEKTLRLITKGKKEGNIKDAEKALADFRTKNLNA